MIKKITKHDIEHILEYPQNYVDANVQEELVSINGITIILAYNDNRFDPYYFRVVYPDGALDISYPDRSLFAGYKTLVSHIKKTSIGFPDLSYLETFRCFLSNDRFLSILEYDNEFYVFKDKETGRYYYFEVSEKEISDFFEVVPAACLSYDITHDIQIEDTFKMSNLFDNVCCGEEVADDAIKYWWFTRREHNV